MTPSAVRPVIYDERVVSHAVEVLAAGNEPDAALAGPPDIRAHVLYRVTGEGAWTTVLSQRRFVALFTDGGLTWDLLRALADRLPPSPRGRFATRNRQRLLEVIGERARTLPWDTTSSEQIDAWLADGGRSSPSGHDLAIALLNEGWRQRLVATDHAALERAAAEAARRNRAKEGGKTSWEPVISGDGSSESILEVPGRLVELPWRGEDAKHQCVANHPYRVHPPRIVVQ
jgi:hypothetical protein